MTELEVGWTVKRKAHKYTSYLILSLEAINGVPTAVLKECDAYRDPGAITELVENLTRVCAVVVHEPGRGIFTHVCGRPSKDEQGLCGVHGGACLRERQKAEQRRVDSEAQQDRIREAKAELEALGVDGNLVVRADHRYVNYWTGRVSLTMDEVRRLAGG